MGTYIVIGAYQFVGFYVTQYLLERGEEVIGVDWGYLKRNQYIIEEKELEIGRNANFTNFPLNKLQFIEISEPCTIFLSCYDSQKEKEDLSHLHIDDIVSFLETCKKNEHVKTLNIVIFLTIEDDTEEFRSLLTSCKEMKSVKMVFLPTLYGPWQPECMSFEAGISQLEQQVIEASLAKEFRQDALFIADFMADLEPILDSSDQNVQLCSGIEDHWNTCAKLVFKKEVITSLPALPTTKITKGSIHKVPNKTTPEEGITLQIEHNKRLNLLQKRIMHNKKE